MGLYSTKTPNKKTMKRFIYLLVVPFILGAQLNAQDSIFISEKLQLKWEVTGLNVPESVLPVAEKGILYVSNIGTDNPSEKEGKGFIAIVTMDGKIKNLKWFVDESKLDIICLSLSRNPVVKRICVVKIRILHIAATKR